MSYDWQSLRRSNLMGPKSGQSLKESQQIRQMLESQQKCRRFSLNAITRSGGLTRDLQTPQQTTSTNSVNSVNTVNTHTHTHTHTHTRSLSDSSSVCSQLPVRPVTSVNGSVNGVIVEGQTTTSKQSLQSLQSLQPLQPLQCNSSVNSVTNCVNHNSGLNIGLNIGLTSAAAMLPIINFESGVPTRTSMEMNGRMSRRASKVSQESFSCSQQSILSAMDRFVKAVNNMDSTVLVPSKLRDMDLNSVKIVRVPPALANTDLHSFYLMLNDVKKELLWGPGTQHNMATSLMPFSGRSSPRDLKHIRQPSDDSLGSLGSTASSSASDQDTDSEADSLMTDKDSIDEHTSHLAAAFRHHLQGLHTILHQLADSADYLSSRYQEDIDASSL